MHKYLYLLGSMAGSAFIILFFMCCTEVRVNQCSIISTDIALCDYDEAGCVYSGDEDEPLQ